MVRVRDNTCYYRVWMNNFWKRGNIISVFQNNRIHVDRACVGSQWLKEYTTSRENCQTKYHLKWLQLFLTALTKTAKTVDTLMYFTIWQYFASIQSGRKCFTFAGICKRQRQTLSKFGFYFLPHTFFGSFLLVVFPFCFP